MMFSRAPLWLSTGLHGTRKAYVGHLDHLSIALRLVPRNKEPVIGVSADDMRVAAAEGGTKV